MTPTEKANELIDKYVKLRITFPYIDMQDGECIGNGYMTYTSAIKCALLEANEILNLNVCWWDESLVKAYPEKYKPEGMYEFWKEVKLIIERK